MARTKKQTLENASERKRQIQEEILRETLAAKQRKENLLSSQTLAHTRGNNPPLVTAGAAASLSQNGLAASGASEGNMGAASHVIKTDSMKGFIGNDINSAGGSTGSLFNATSAMNQGDLPKAVIRIPDICRSPSQSVEEEPVGKGSRESSPRGQGSRGRSCTATSGGHSLECQDYVVRQRQENQKQTGKNSATNVAASLKTLKAASEKVREEKRIKSRHRSSSPSPNKAGSKTQTSSPGRRSPRQHSPLSSRDSHSGGSSHKSRSKKPQSVSAEKPKVNIFTDNLGIDLGKRIRSPRRLSEDMIALPIFSVRRWSSSPKDSPPVTMSGGGRSAEDNPVFDGMESLAAHGNPNTESFKYPGTSPSPSKRSISSGSPQKTPSSSSKNSTFSGSPQKTPPSTGSKSSEDSIPPRRHRGVKSRESSPSAGHAKSELQPELENSNEELLSKSYPLRNSKMVPRELQFSEEAKSLRKSSRNREVPDDNRDICNDSTASSGSSNSGKVESQSSRPESSRKSLVRAKKEKLKSQKVEELMSSICRELMSDVVIPKSDDKVIDKGNATDYIYKRENLIEDCPLEQSKCEKDDCPVQIPESEKEECPVPASKSEEEHYSGQLSESKKADWVVKASESEKTDCLRLTSNSETVTTADIDAMEAGTVDICHQILSTHKKDMKSNADPLMGTAGRGSSVETVDEKPQSSLLCAMLIGGTEVAHTYSKERQKCKPQLMETSDHETDHSTSSCEQASKKANPPIETKLRNPRGQSPSSASIAPKGNPSKNTQDSCDSKDSHNIHPTEGPNCSHKNEIKAENGHTQMPYERKDSDIAVPTKSQSTSQKSGVKVKDGHELSDEAIACSTEAPEADAGETGDILGTCDKKKASLDLSSKLKKLDENVLKLLDIDVEEEFLKDLEVDENFEVDGVPPVQCAHTELKELQGCDQDGEARLYNLISSLGSRLRGTDDGIPNLTPVDIELVEKLIQCCPKTAPSIVPKLKFASRMEKIQKRLMEEERKEANQVRTRSGTQRVQSSPEGQSYIQSSAKCQVTSTDNKVDSSSDSLAEETSQKQMQICDSAKMNKQDVSGNSEEMAETSACPSSVNTPLSVLENLPAIMTASTSSLNDSLSELDTEAMTSAVTDVVNLGMEHDSGEVNKKAGSSQLSSCLDSEDGQDSLSKASSKRSFQKSKTCDDFKEEAHSASSTLRRINSSPQINAKLPPSPASSMFNTSKETQVKSKLGSKIPVPGTSYCTKSVKKTWRIPRIIKEPRPLSVLSELEETSSQPQNVFTCANLQKYLNVPSNRVIVPPEKREEMHRLDAKAKEEEEKRETAMKELAEKEKKSEEEINSEYSKCEPDFDEVDGMLFMSFSNEVELTAHIRVEKALEWDKDDTMLRISRAKAFEEAKAHNEDMGDFKLKHLRGQHMRWKKYRRLYSSEVKALLDAKEKGVPLETLTAPKKTSDVTKIKGWKKKQQALAQGSTPSSPLVSQDLMVQTPTVKLEESKEMELVPNFGRNEDAQFADENMMEGMEDKPDLSPRSKRRQGFSHQKAHKQLFRELNMDWEDRMIHRKLGGWSLKGNRPRAFSRAAQKRQEKESRENDALNAEIKDISLDTSNLEEPENEITPEKKGQSEPKKKKVIKIIYPLLTEKMARNALRTLEMGDIRRGIKRKKKRHRHDSNSNLPALTPIPVPICQPSGIVATPEAPSTPLSAAATVGSSPVTNLSTPPPQQQLQDTMAIPSSTSASSASTPLQLDLHDEPVMEGVDTAAENMSSPSLADTSSSRSCSKPGCRYGCICHLCSVSEASIPPPSAVAKPPTPACEKEYCRLGCICDSIDPEKPIPDSSHCGKPSCMLQCVCSDPGSLDGSDDIPYLPSMKRRPKPGERFSNLPQRERTHRSAKNLDAITRKAMMLYETSEIYCEKVERVRRKPDATDTPTSTPLVSPSQTPVSHISIKCSSDTFDIELESEPAVVDVDNIQSDTLFTAVNLATSEATTIAASHLVKSSSLASQHLHSKTKVRPKPSKPFFVIDDIRQTLPNMEPSAHKRKRKSHPLSDEIFSSSTCARTQPFKHQIADQTVGSTTTGEEQEGNVQTTQGPTLRNRTPTGRPTGFQAIDIDDGPEQILPRITSVQTLAPGASDITQWDDMEQSGKIIFDASERKHTAKSSGSTNQPLSISFQGSHHSSSGSTANTRQHHGWHTSMVCLKARAPPSPQSPGEEDVQEEDEVKLLEFAANCNWEGAKKEILARVAQCLTRGQYPQPRTMNVCEFVVEILPKAHQPSLIPPELRAKLPGQMYSIRVRITRRESVSKAESDADIIDLSEPSPVKSSSSHKGDEPKSRKSVVRNLNDSLSSSNKQQLSTSATTTSVSDSSVINSSSFGISGLSKLCINSQPFSGQNNQEASVSCTQAISLSSLKLTPARRASLEGKLGNKSSDNEQKPGTGTSPSSVQTSVKSDIKLKGSSFVISHDGPSLKATFNSIMNSDTITTATTSLSPSVLKLTTSSATTQAGKAGKISSLQPPRVTKTVSSVPPILGPFNAKDVKFMKLPGQEVMKFIEVGSASDKNKKQLIAVPLALSKTPVDLKGKQGTVPLVALPVSGTGQNKLVPLKSVASSTSPQILVRLPSGTGHSTAVSSVMHPMVFQQLPRFQVVPLPVASNVTVAQSKTTATSDAVQSPKVSVSKPKTLNSNDEMIMVFDAAHIKASQLSKPSVPMPTTSSNRDKEPLMSSEKGGKSVSTLVTASRNRPIMSSEISPSKLQTQLNGAIDLTAEEVPVEDSQAGSEDADSKGSTPKGFDECDGCVDNNTVSEAQSTDMDLQQGLVAEQDREKSSGDCSADTVIMTLPNASKGKISVIASLPSTLDECEIKSIISVSSASSQVDENLNKDRERLNTVQKSPVPSEGIHSSSITSTASTTPKSFITASENTPPSYYESVPTGSKRSLPASPGEKETLPLCPKRRCLSSENPVVMDEDSSASLNSLSGFQGAEASPQDRPKSVASLSLSTGSSDDLVLLFSSEEEVDVGVNESPQAVLDHRGRAERALENDHGSMYSKVEPSGPLPQEHAQCQIVQQVAPPKKHSKSKLQDKGKYHNQLERLRRSRLKTLFDELQHQVEYERGLTKKQSITMSKAQVLVEAKKVVQELCKRAQDGDQQVKEYERKKKLLEKKLARVKAKMLDSNIPIDATSAVLLQVAPSLSVHSLEAEEIPKTPLPVINELSINTDIDEHPDTVNLVSPSTEDDKASDRANMITPVYEDISDPEDSNAPKYEDISDPEEVAPKYEDISDS